MYLDKIFILGNRRALLGCNYRQLGTTSGLLRRVIEKLPRPAVFIRYDTLEVFNLSG